MHAVFRFWGLTFLILFCSALSAMTRTYDYELRTDPTRPHTFLVKLTTQVQTPEYTDFYINAWRPGRYILWNYSAGMIDFRPVDEAGKLLKWRKIDKDIWRVYHSPEVKKITADYSYYGFRDDAGGNMATDEVLYFNPVCFFMTVGKDYSAPCTLTLPDLNRAWRQATALRPTGKYNVFTAVDYHEFADCPSVFSQKLTQFKTDADGFPVYVHFYGNYKVPAGKEKGFLEDVVKIIKEQKAVFGEIPADEHHFIYFLSNRPIRHAVEHLRSSMYYMPEAVAQTAESLKGLYSITSHEFWHVWNIKSLRPASLYPYDYTKEHHTGLHWFTEGVTDYYADLILARAGLVTHENFLKDQAYTIKSLENSYAASVISPEQCSADSWLGTSEFYPHFLRTSFYPLGTRVALLMDWELFRMSDGKYSFDDVFRILYKKYFKQNQGIPEDGVQEAFEELTGRSWDGFFEKYVRGTEKIDYNSFSQAVDIKTAITPEIENKSANKLRYLGVTSAEATADGVVIRQVKPGSDAQQYGIFDQTLIIEIEGKPASSVFSELKLKTGQRIKMKVEYSWSDEPREIEVIYTGKDAVIDYAFEIKGTEKVNRWLKSRVK